MTFRNKVFFAIFTISTLLSVLIGCVSYIYASHYIKKIFISTYKLDLNQIGSMLLQFENAVEIRGIDALYVLKDTEAHDGLPSDNQLKSLASKLKVSNFFVTNAKGKFIRSTNGKITDNIFHYCAAYKGLITGESKIFRTPIILSSGESMPGPFKYIMTSNKSHTRILESSIRLDFIDKLLKTALQTKHDFVNIKVYTPNYQLLGDVYNKNLDNTKNVIHLKEIVYLSLPDCCECKTKRISSSAGNYYYILKAKVTTASINKTLQSLLLSISIIDLFFIVFGFFISKYLTERVIANFKNLHSQLDKIISNSVFQNVDVIGKDEISALSSHINKLLKIIKKNEERLIEAERNKAMTKIAAQVAHDIRSPLTALEMIITRLPEIEESKYILLRDSINHIRDITNNLDKKNVLPESAEFQDASIQIAVLLDYVISERRAAFSNPSICILHDFSAEAYGFFVQADRSEMKRILTNLINNSYEAVLNHGNKITIALHKNNEHVEIIISDNGSGISDEISASLFARGFTTKKSGSGLGLFHAKETLSQWGGKIELHNNISQGAFATITLPLQKSPDWFLDELFFQKNSTVICVDDSISIFHAWQERFKGLSGNIDLQYAKSKEALLSIIEKNKNNICTYLIDYEFSGKPYNGLDLIDIILLSKSEASRIFLVTSRSDEIHIQQFCAENNIQMIPKFFAFKIVLRMDEQ